MSGFFKNTSEDSRIIVVRKEMNETKERFFAFIGKLEDLGKQHKGAVPFYLQLGSEEEQILLDPLPTRRLMINPVNEVIREVKRVIDGKVKVMK